MSHEEHTPVPGLEGTCEEKLSRRDLARGLRTLRTALAGVGAVGVGGAAAAQDLFTSQSPTESRLPKQLVPGSTGAKPAFLLSIFLRGGADGLSILAPCDDPNYQAARDATRVWNPSDAGLPDPSMAGLPLTAGIPGLPDFWMPKVLQPLKNLFDEPNSKLALFHASGSVDQTRSHFEQQNQMESGTTGNASPPLPSGWCGRHLVTKTDHFIGKGLFRGFSYSNFLAQTLNGGQGVTPIPDPTNYAFPIVTGASPAQEAARADALETMYDKFGDPLDTSMESVLKAIAVLNSIDFDSYTPAPGVAYPTTKFGTELKHTAQLAKSVGKLEVVQLNTGSWDTHDAQGVFASGGRMYDLMDELAKGLEAFKKDMVDDGREFVVLVMTEFGRTLAENSSGGTDHGHGGVTIAMGTNVMGGQIYGTWPGLAPGQLDIGDMVTTTDIRDIIGEVVVSALKNPNTGIVVPPEPGMYEYAPVGFMA